jgi:hypothetical protein
LSIGVGVSPGSVRPLPGGNVRGGVKYALGFFFFSVAPIGPAGVFELPFRRTTVVLPGTRTISVDDLRAPPAHPTDLPRLVRAPDAEPIPGFRLLDALGGGSGKVWQCEEPAGLFEALSFVPGPHTLTDRALARQGLPAWPRGKVVPSPRLRPLDRVERVAGG